MTNTECRCYNYETLARLLIKEKRKGMNMNAILEVFGHLDECSACREAIYQISRDRDSSLFNHSREDPDIRHPRDLKDSNSGH